jgi:hypothetical protein
MPPGDTSRLYHRLTAYSPEREFTDPLDDPRIVQGFVQNDYATVPPFCKAYPDGLPRVELPREWEHGPAATLALAGRASARPLSLSALARLLFLSSGVVRTSHRRGRNWLFRGGGGRPAGASRSSSTYRRAASTASATGSTGTTRWGMRCCGSGRRRRARRRR